MDLHSKLLKMQELYREVMQIKIEETPSIETETEEVKTEEPLKIEEKPQEPEQQIVVEKVVLPEWIFINRENSCLVGEKAPETTSVLRYQGNYGRADLLEWINKMIGNELIQKITNKQNYFETEQKEEETKEETKGVKVSDPRKKTILAPLLWMQPL